MPKVAISDDLNLQILKVQVDNSTDWETACSLTAEILSNFDKKVKAMAERIYNSRFFSQLNKARKGDYDKGYREGYEAASNKFKIHYFCSICGEKLSISPNGEDHKALISYMKDHGWAHTRCLQR